MELRWWKEAVAYQIYPKSFYDSNGDGIGDIKGITLKLDYIKELGVDVIWLSPFFKSPMRDNGYDISDYLTVDAMFGCNQDIDKLLEEARKRDIKVLVDLVFNHSSSEHEWFQQALQDKESQFRDYYIFKETENSEIPNNWRSIFGGSVWEKVNDGCYYMHTFDKTQPDLNWENENLRKSIYDVIDFWIKKGVGGFRIDAITFIKKNQSFKSLPPDSNDGLVNVGRSTLNQEGIHSFLKEMNEKTYGRHNLMTVAEAPGVPYEDLEEYIGDNGSFSMLFDFSYTDMDLDSNGYWYPKREWFIDEFRSLLFKSQLSVQKIGWGALFIESHDQPRSIDKFFGIEDTQREVTDYLKGSALATMYFLLRGTPYIYQGQEIGMRNYPFEDIAEYDDIATKDQYMRAISLGASVGEALKIAAQRSRDHSRTPMQWDNTENAGFSKASSWLPIHPNYHEKNILNQLESESSLLNYYKKLIHIRKSYKDILVYGYMEPVLTEYSGIIAYRRYLLKEKDIIVIVNMSNSEREIIQPYKKVNVICSNYKRESIGANNVPIKMEAYEALVLMI